MPWTPILRLSKYSFTSNGTFVTSSGHSSSRTYVTSAINHVIFLVSSKVTIALKSKRLREQHITSLMCNLRVNFT